MPPLMGAYAIDKFKFYWSLNNEHYMDPQQYHVSTTKGGISRG